MSFRTFGLEEGILRAIEKAGYPRPTAVQEAAIPQVMHGHDVIAIAQTGTGKSAAFIWPILHQLTRKRPANRRLHALVLAPTRELAIQLTGNFLSYGRHQQLRVATIHGGTDEAAQARALTRGVDVVIATPGRLLDLTCRGNHDFSALETVVLDEADRLLHMGFRPDIEAIMEMLPSRRQTLMFSATFPKEVEALARRFLYHPKLVQIGKRADPADGVSHSVYEVPAHLKGALMMELLRQPGFDKVLVFTRTKDGADRLTDILRNAGTKVARLHSSRSQTQRTQALDEFRKGVIQVLVATDIAARGLDVIGITHVVNYDFPVNPEDYVHRIGRTGRAAAQGHAISLVPKHDLNLLGIVEFFIGRRLPRRRLKGFNYQATAPIHDSPAKPERRDWRKRTREKEAKGATRPEVRKRFNGKAAPKQHKTVEPARAAKPTAANKLRKH